MHVRCWRMTPFPSSLFLAACLPNIDVVEGFGLYCSCHPLISLRRTPGLSLHQIKSNRVCLSAFLSLACDIGRFSTPKIFAYRADHGILSFTEMLSHAHPVTFGGLTPKQFSTEATVVLSCLVACNNMVAKSQNPKTPGKHLPGAVISKTPLGRS